MEKYGHGMVYDRELWEPGVGSGRKMVCSSELAYMEDLAWRLAALGLLESKKKHSEKQQPGLLPPLRSNFDLPPPSQGFRRDEGITEEGFGFEVWMAGQKGFPEHRRRPVGEFGEGRGRLRQHYALNVVPNRTPILSPEVGGGGLRLNTISRRMQAPVIPTKLMGPRRRCTGTGVFLPRVVHYDSNNCPELKNNGMQKQEQQLLQQKMVVSNQKGTSYHAPSLPAELLLPQDWTY